MEGGGLFQVTLFVTRRSITPKCKAGLVFETFTWLSAELVKDRHSNFSVSGGDRAEKTSIFYRALLEDGQRIEVLLSIVHNVSLDFLTSLT